MLNTRITSSVLLNSVYQDLMLKIKTVMKMGPAYDTERTRIDKGMAERTIFSYFSATITALVCLNSSAIFSEIKQCVSLSGYL